MGKPQKPAKKPLILCPVASFTVSGVSRKGMNTSYITAIEKAGGIALPFAWVDSGKPTLEHNLKQLLPLVSGIMIQGGCDIHPSIYREKPRSKKAVESCDRYRDYIEYRVLTLALEFRIPFLAICRGMQMLNVVYGGKLYQDLSLDRLNIHYHKDRSQLVHSVGIVKASMLHGLFGLDEIRVNSIHHQGIKRLGRGLYPSAVGPDGLIEALELEDHPYGLGVQWHPEEIPHHRNIFESFVNAAKRQHV